MLSATVQPFTLQQPELTERVAAESLYTMAYQLFEAGRVAEAIKLFRVVMQLMPEDERGWLGTGVCHESLGQLDLAGNLYAAAMVSTGGSVRCALSFHRVMQQLGRDEQAQRAFEQARLWAEQGEDEQEQRLVQMLIQGGAAS